MDGKWIAFAEFVVILLSTQSTSHKKSSFHSHTLPVEQTLTQFDKLGKLALAHIQAHLTSQSALSGT